MIKILKIIQKSSFLLCIFFFTYANAMEVEDCREKPDGIIPMKWVDFTETPEGHIHISIKNKYPIQIFDADEFNEEMNNNITFTDKSIVGLDLSNDASVNKRDVKAVLSYCKKENIPLSSLNISKTNTDYGIVGELKDLLDNEQFKCLDISGPRAVEAIEKLANNPKIIFIEKGDYDKADKFYLQYQYGIELINRHIKYYIEKGLYSDDPLG